MSRRPSATPKLRCAIYTRKSSEEGLEQGFNSLHAQREACEAYVKSQAGEGWSALAAEYDDGGFSGGSMDRPGLSQLLADIGAGRIDVVVVYKVDRLTRSLTDFARIVELFDRHEVSFVSVTQAFNTTTSMGRLTLNVLLSFAQFEREVTGERIRDKIAASKAKGMWMGGGLPLGYDAPTDPTTRALVVNEAEAETVRLIFRRYLELGSVKRLAQWLSEQEIRSKSRLTRDGRLVGGMPFNRGALYHLLQNQHYVGWIVHKGQIHHGRHPAIVDEPIFAAVQDQLAQAARRHRDSPKRVSTALLKGLVFDADGAPMSPVFTHGAKGQVYRYYVSTSLHQGRVDRGGEAIRRAPADALEKIVRTCLQQLRPEIDDGDLKRSNLRVEVHATSLQIVVGRAALLSRPGDPDSDCATLARRLREGERVNLEADDPLLVRVTLPIRMKLRGGRIWITGAGGRLPNRRPDQAMVKALKAAHHLMAQIGATGIGALETAIPEQAPKNAYDRMIIRIAFLAPDIQTAILEGRQPPELNLERLVHQRIPASWADQRQLYGVAS